MIYDGILGGDCDWPCLATGVLVFLQVYIYVRFRSSAGLPIYQSIVHRHHGGDYEKEAEGD